MRYVEFGLACSLSATTLRHSRCLIGGGGIIIRFYYAFIITWSALFLKFHDEQKSCSRVEKQSTRSESGKLHWQGYPTSLSHQLTWLLDAFGSLHGAGWNWRIPCLPCLPEVLDQTAKENGPSWNTKASNSGSNATALLKFSILRTARYYMLMGMLKVVTMYDPYFWGVASAPTLPPLDMIYHLSLAPTQLFRAIASVLWIRTVMAYLASMVPLAIGTVLTLFPGLSSLTLVPYDATWLYQPLFERFFDRSVKCAEFSNGGRWRHEGLFLRSPTTDSCTCVIMITCIRWRRSHGTLKCNARRK